MSDSSVVTFEEVSSVVSQLFPEEWEIIGKSNREDVITAALAHDRTSGAIEVEGGGAMDLTSLIQIIFAAATFVTATASLVKRLRDLPDKFEIKQSVEAVITAELLDKLPEDKRLEAISILTRAKN